MILNNSDVVPILHDGFSTSCSKIKKNHEYGHKNEVKKPFCPITDLIDLVALFIVDNPMFFSFPLYIDKGNLNHGDATME